MTEDGWRPIKELAENNSHIKVATLNPDQNTVEYHYPDRWVINDYSGKMFHQNSATVDILVTPEHKMWLNQRPWREDSKFEFVEASKSKKLVRYQKYFPWQEGEEVKFFTLPEYSSNNCRFRPNRQFCMDGWLKLLGIYLAEGWVDGTAYTTKSGVKHGKHVVGIAQEKESGREIIEEWLNNLDLDFVSDWRCFRICDVQMANWFSSLGQARDKYIPKEFKNLSRRQLQILLEAMLLGDGWQYDSGFRYVSYSKQLANDVNEIATKIGYRVTQYDDPNPDVPRHILTISKHQMNPVVNGSNDDREWIDYDGKVYCLTVQNHLVYVRRNGKPCWSSQCAYTQKVVKLCQMLTSLGHTVYHYGCEGSDPVCTESVDIVTDQYRQSFYPNEYESKFFKFDTTDEFHKTFYANAIKGIEKRGETKDFILSAWGWGHQPVTVPFENRMMSVESGIGYESTFARYRVFESYAWMHYIYGTGKIGDGSYYDVVIPNYFDPHDFDFKTKEQRGDYFLYIGRLIKRKGVDIAAQVCDHIGARLVLAGQGELKNPGEGIDLTVYKSIDFVGFADVEKRKHLMSEAKGVFVPTIYIEPFGGVNVEAQMSGTPVIASDWGAFPETVLHGVTGYRCRTFEQFAWAARNIGNIDNAACREWAVKNYSVERIAPMYDEYFHSLYDLWSQGWYEPHPDRTQLDWLNRYYPTHR
jgi:glycosyltransferase involved in cell wall biosynthesis